MRKVLIAALVLSLVVGFAGVVKAEDEGFSKIAVKVGYISPAESDIDGSIAAGVEYAIQENEKSAITLGVNYAQPKVEDVDLTWLNVGATYKMKFAKEDVVGGPYAGLGIDWVKIKITDFDFDENTVGGHVVAGYEFGGKYLVEAKYISAKKDDVKYGGLLFMAGMKF